MGVNEGKISYLSKRRQGKFYQLIIANLPNPWPLNLKRKAQLSYFDKKDIVENLLT